MVYSQLSFIVSYIASSLLHIWPYLLISVALSTTIHLLNLSRVINNAFNKKPLVSIFLATLIGAVSPFCSCGVIPVITSLLISGVPLAPVMSFWLASPSMDPEVFFLSVTMVGWQLAVWRFASTFIISLSAGYITHWFVSKNIIDKKSILNINKKTCCDGGCSKSKCSPQKPTFVKMAIKEATSSALFIIKYMILAYFLESLIKLYIPDTLIFSLLGAGNRFAIETATLIGIPFYTTNIAALGIVRGLLAQGMDPAAALSFLISGAVTTLPAMSAVYGIATRKVFFLYLAFSVFGSLLFGYIFQLFN